MPPMQTPRLNCMATMRVNGVFEGKRVVIIAGGPSVTLQDIHRIARARLDLGSDLRVIAVNDAVFVAWWADWLHASDARWWNWNIQRIRQFNGIRTTIDPTVPKGWAHHLDNTGKEGFDPDPANCRNGGNSAYQAMHCAIHAGASSIVLVGVDMDRSGHWHPEYENVPTCDRPAVMLPAFQTLAPTLAERRIKVVNVSPRSLLEIWPKVSLESALA